MGVVRPDRAEAPRAEADESQRGETGLGGLGQRRELAKRRGA